MFHPIYRSIVISPTMNHVKISFHIAESRCFDNITQKFYLPCKYFLCIHDAHMDCLLVRKIHVLLAMVALHIVSSEQIPNPPLSFDLHKKAQPRPCQLPFHRKLLSIELIAMMVRLGI